MAVSQFWWTAGQARHPPRSRLRNQVEPASGESGADSEVQSITIVCLSSLSSYKLTLPTSPGCGDECRDQTVWDGQPSPRHAA